MIITGILLAAIVGGFCIIIWLASFIINLTIKSLIQHIGRWGVPITLIAVLISSLLLVLNLNKTIASNLPHQIIDRSKVYSADGIIVKINKSRKEILDLSQCHSDRHFGYCKWYIRIADNRFYANDLSIFHGILVMEFFGIQAIADDPVLTIDYSELNKAYMLLIWGMIVLLIWVTFACFSLIFSANLTSELRRDYRFFRTPC